jgi:hypothetical protein
MATVEVKVKITGKVKQNIDEMRATMLQISGKEIRTLMQRGSRKSHGMRWERSKRAFIKSIRKSHPGLTPNKIARMIRRNFARAEVRATRPLMAIKPDFSELRSSDGKDLDSAFRGQG